MTAFIKFPIVKGKIFANCLQQTLTLPKQKWIISGYRNGGALSSLILWLAHIWICTFCILFELIDMKTGVSFEILNTQENKQTYNNSKVGHLFIYMTCCLPAILSLLFHFYLFPLSLVLYQVMSASCCHEKTSRFLSLKLHQVRYL